MSGNRRDPGPADMHSEGPWPFITLRKYTHHGRPILWRARQHRKGLAPAERGLDAERAPFWRKRRYNWVTGLIFSIGSLLFMLGAIFSLMPKDWAATPSLFVIGVIFFMGSVPFTTAGYMQHFQAANAPEFQTDSGQEAPIRRVSIIGWHPASPGWLSTFTQFIGTIAFNFNTFDALRPAAGWYTQDLTIWLPDMVGSVLFLVSGYLAFIETCHGYWAWRPGQLDWRIVFVNLLGCVFFLVAAILAYIPKATEPDWMPTMANITLWLGALGFLVGAQLLMRESRQAAD